MANSYFQFKKFTVHQEGCAMKVGTDGVLLGAWVRLERATQVLDIGTGSGLIALMVAQRSEAQIEAIEIDELAAEQALHNFCNSPWRDRMKVCCTALQTYQADKQFDLIVSNPPYYVNALFSPDSKRAQARNTEALPFVVLAQKAARLLAPHGEFSVVLPVTAADEFTWQCWENDLYLSRRCVVLPRADKPAKRVLLAFKKERTCTEETTLCLEHADRSYTAEYGEMVREFYLKL